MGRSPCCDKANVKKGPWSPEEDVKLKQYIQNHGTSGNWISLPQKAGLKRCGKSCRLRWLNYLRPDIKHGDFSHEEDTLICNLFATIGSRWSVIAAQLPGRTDNDIKNYWNTKLKKKLITPPSTSSSSSSPSDSNRSGFPQTPATWSFSGFDPVQFSPNYHLNGTSFSYNAAPIHQESSFVSSMIQNSHVTDGFLMFAGEASCSSSDGSFINQIGAGNEQIGRRSYFHDGMWRETPLMDYGLEEIRQLISTGSCGNVFFDEN